MKMMAKLKDTFYWNLVYEDRYQLILEGLKITLLLSLPPSCWAACWAYCSAWPSAAATAGSACRCGCSPL